MPPGSHQLPLRRNTQSEAMAANPASKQRHMGTIKQDETGNHRL